MESWEYLMASITTTDRYYPNTSNEEAETQGGI